MKLVKTLKIPITGSRQNMALLGRLLEEEQRLINNALTILAQPRPSPLSRNDALRILGRRTSQQYILRDTGITRQIFAEGIVTKAFQLYEGQSRAFRQRLYRQVRTWDWVDLVVLRKVIEAQGGSWAGLRGTTAGGSLPFGLTAETAGEVARSERVPMRPIQKPLAFLRSRTLRFVKTRRGNLGVILLHPWRRGHRLFFRVRGHGRDAFIEELMRREGQGRGTATAELRVEDDRFVLCVLYAREVSPPTYVPETYVGVDLGYVNIAVAAAVTPDGKRLIRPKFWSAGSVRGRLNVLRARDAAHQSCGKRPVTTAHHRRYWTYRIARELVEFAKGFPSPALVLEDLRGLRHGRRDWGRRANGEFHTWDHGRMYRFVEHLAGWEGLRVLRVPPRGTSSTCPKCGGPVNRNRKKRASRCRNPACGYQNNDDLIGAFNVALRGASVAPYPTSPAKRLHLHAGTSTRGEPEFHRLRGHRVRPQMIQGGDRGERSSSNVANPTSRGTLAASPGPHRAVRRQTGQA